MGPPAAPPYLLEVAIVVDAAVIVAIQVTENGRELGYRDAIRPKHAGIATQGGLRQRQHLGRCQTVQRSADDLQSVETWLDDARAREVDVELQRRRLRAELTRGGGRRVLVVLRQRPRCSTIRQVSGDGGRGAQADAVIGLRAADQHTL